MDRASDFGSDGWGFESLRTHRQICDLTSGDMVRWPLRAGYSIAHDRIWFEIEGVEACAVMSWVYVVGLASNWRKAANGTRPL